MFALLLQRMVTTIHTDRACARLLHNAWYLDDGSMAGESSSVLRALAILQAHWDHKNLVLVTSHHSLCLYRHQTNLTWKFWGHLLGKLNFVKTSSLVNIKKP